jgi:V/A-type H+-transporting ATPase subunit E
LWSFFDIFARIQITFAIILNMDKLQELTQKLYNEGLAKGKEEGEALLAKATAQAEEIVKQAQAQASAIVEKAQKEAQDYKVKMEGDVKMASTQALQATKAGIEGLIVAKAVEPVKEQLSGAAFLKEIITTVAQRFSTQEATDLSLVLPEKLQKELEPFVKGELAKTLGKGVEASFSKKVAGGFKIGPKDGSYFISLTDEAFQGLIGEFLRPATKKILFG